MSHFGGHRRHSPYGEGNRHIPTEPPAADCPTPDKLGFRSRGDARLYRKRRRDRPGFPDGVTVYRCICGRFHLGNVHPDGRARSREIAAGKLGEVMPTHDHLANPHRV